MALVSIAGLSVIDGSIAFPRSGAWTATLTLRGEDVPRGRVSIEAPGLVLSGTVLGGGSAYARTTVRVVGGAGQLSRVIGPRWWRNAPLRLPLAAACEDAGETLSTSVAPSVLSTTLSAWARGEARAASELADLADLAGSVWRVLDDGSVWLGVDSWPTLEIDHRVTDVHVADRWRELALESYSVRPGVVLDGLHVGRVTYRITGERVRCELLGVDP